MPEAKSQEESRTSADNDVNKPTETQFDISSDTFSPDEQEKIVRMVKIDIEADIQSSKEWIADRQKDIQMYEGDKPSKIENLTKKAWMSDRNLGMTAATCDTYQATLLATTYNIDTLHFIATEENDVDRKDQLVKFTKWGLGEKEANFFPEADDFIHNKITQGISYFHTYWEVKYKWIDRRIPKYKKDKEGKPVFSHYEIKTERKRFERGVIENIPDVSDLLFPREGKNLQEKKHLIHRTKKYTAKDILDFGKEGRFVDVSAEYVATLKKYCYDNRFDILSKEKADQLGILQENDLSEDDLSIFPIPLYQWYGMYKKNGKEEEYRFIIEPETSKFLSGKPLRKITRSGKRPYVGRPFIRRPGFVRGGSLPRLIADPTNALNNTYNQKSDFQYVENCPSGWYSPDEIHKAQVQEIIPGLLNPTADPDTVNIPNLSRSLAWAESDFRLFFEIIEKLTGAASYFMSNKQGVSGTATRDAIINEKSETRFGLWVKRILLDICEAITMWIEMYQDWAPDDLGERILGEDGKKLFPNFSIETILGGYDARITPDIISGSRTLKKEIALWAYEALSLSPWFSPQINPRGNWRLARNAAKESGLIDIEQDMPPEPKPTFPEAKPIKDKWAQLKQGTIPEIEPTDDIIALYMGFMEIDDTKREELDKEYQPNLDFFIFKLNVAMQKEMQRIQNEQIANNMAMKLIGDVEQGRMKKKDVINA